MPMPSEHTPSKAISVKMWHALVPVTALIGLIAVTLLKFGGEAHIPLVLASGIAAVVGLSCGHTWKTIEDGIVNGIQIGMKAVLIDRKSVV